MGTKIMKYNGVVGRCTNDAIKIFQYKWAKEWMT
ncbi:uncharacterized protein METZ01_LOCUS338833 [marine metagenome]|uniref:Peptidoglycan binding-like domain-containing protein n=1 Tax=marine metagenome TaxID=408172 RepID=A0A382QKC6_9ZZZZ